MEPVGGGDAATLTVGTMLCGQTIQRHGEAGGDDRGRLRLQQIQRVQPIVSMRDQAKAAATSTASKHKQSYDFTLKGSDWMDTGVTLAAGERASFTATGTFTLADARVAEPDGLARGWKDLLRQFPLNSANVGRWWGG